MKYRSANYCKMAQDFERQASSISQETQDKTEQISEKINLGNE